jgi:DNA-binding winged helix-turn-helix (wHTH) protein
MAMLDLAKTLEPETARVVTLTAGRRAGTSATIRRFEAFALDVRSRELRVGDRSVMLQAQPFELLRMLLDRAGDVVDREDLRRRLWPDGTFVDYEHGLNAAIRRLRHILGDDAVNPRFIETIPRRGYRFIAPVFGGVVSHRPTPAETHAVRLAVLPFVQMGPVNEWADVLDDELRAQVARKCAGGVSVISRSSSMVCADQSQRTSVIGKELQADYLLEGSVRGDGDRVRITASLIETTTETLIWSDTVERRGTVTLSAQVDVATRLAQSLTRKLLSTR